MRAHSRGPVPSGERRNASPRSCIDLGFGVGVGVDLKESAGPGRVFPEGRPKRWVTECFGKPWQVNINRGQTIQGLADGFKFFVLILTTMGCH